MDTSISSCRQQTGLQAHLRLLSDGHLHQQQQVQGISRHQVQGISRHHQQAEADEQQLQLSAV